jgi:hypothetical protein
VSHNKEPPVNGVEFAGNRSPDLSTVRRETLPPRPSASAKNPFLIS